MKSNFSSAWGDYHNHDCWGFDHNYRPINYSYPPWNNCHSAWSYRNPSWSDRHRSWSYSHPARNRRNTTGDHHSSWIHHYNNARWYYNILHTSRSSGDLHNHFHGCRWHHGNSRRIHRNSNWLCFSCTCEDMSTPDSNVHTGCQTSQGIHLGLSTTLCLQSSKASRM